MNSCIILVMGVSGSGKSTVASELAKYLGCPFLEGDDFHPLANIKKMNAGTPLTDEDRQPWLSQLGLALKTCAEQNTICVVSCSALKYDYRQTLMQIASKPVVLIYLYADSKVLYERIAGRASHFMPASLLQSQLAVLEPPRENENALYLDAEQVKSKIVEKIISHLTVGK